LWHAAICLLDVAHLCIKVTIVVVGGSAASIGSSPAGVLLLRACTAH
jgi:hypothetical protein